MDSGRLYEEKDEARGDRSLIISGHQRKRLCGARERTGKGVKTSTVMGLVYGKDLGVIEDL